MKPWLTKKYTVEVDIYFRTDLSGCNWLLVLPAEQLDRLRIMPKVLLTPHKDHWYPAAKVVDFTDPLNEGNCINIVHFVWGIRRLIPSPLHFRGSRGDRWHNI